MPLSEADTSRKFIIPKLQSAGWDNDPHSIAGQRSINDGRIIPSGKGFIRRPPRRVDYLLRYERNFPLAVVEAKAAWKTAGEGRQQAKDYAKTAFPFPGHCFAIPSFQMSLACQCQETWNSRTTKPDG